MDANTKNMLFIIAIIALVIIAFPLAIGFVFGEFECINFKEEFIHIHAIMEPKPPANIGIEFENGKVSCYKEMHTHWQDGWLHLESNNLNRTFTVGEFFEEWGLGTDNRALMINNQSASFDTPLKNMDKVFVFGLKIPQ